MVRKSPRRIAKALAELPEGVPGYTYAGGQWFENEFVSLASFCNMTRACLERAYDDPEDGVIKADLYQSYLQTAIDWPDRYERYKGSFGNGN